ncbi:MAG: tRNA (adenosine(37)-N6)-dimethylallyltransferase MiaA [Thermodesulfobacteriota bacterium]
MAKKTETLPIDHLPVVCLVGPTAIGKTGLSLVLANELHAEIVSVDSMQVYRCLDIGTAKATPEERQRVPHHLIDIVNPDEEYHVARFIADAPAAIRAIRDRGRLPLLVGGTGLYLKGLLEGLFHVPPIPREIRNALQQRLEGEGEKALHAELARLDPESARRIPPGDRQRLLRALEIMEASGIPWSQWLSQKEQTPLLDNVLVIGLDCDRERLYRRINRRVAQMAEAGLLDEVRGLLARGYDPRLKPLQSIGYRHMIRYLGGELGWEQTLELLARDTRRYAKRQITWFRHMTGIQWFAPEQIEAVRERVEHFLSASPHGTPPAGPLL